MRGSLVRGEYFGHAAVSRKQEDAACCRESPAEVSPSKVQKSRPRGERSVDGFGYVHCEVFREPFGVCNEIGMINSGRSEYFDGKLSAAMPILLLRYLSLEVSGGVIEDCAEDPTKKS